MQAVFFCCYALEKIDLTNFNTQNAINMGYMFLGCTSLLSLDVSSFDTKNVVFMDYMFSSCDKLTSLDVSNFDTQNVMTMNYMFCNHSLISLDLSNFNFKNVNSMKYMFSGCYSLKFLDISSLIPISNFDGPTFSEDCVIKINKMADKNKFLTKLLYKGIKTNLFIY